MSNKKKNINGLIGTLIFHGALLAILLLFSFSKTEMIYPDPHGVTVDFGEVVQGQNVVTPETQPQDEPPQPESTPAEASTAAPDYATQNNVEAPVVKTNKNEKESKEEKVDAEAEARIKAEEEARKKIDVHNDVWNRVGNPGNSTNGKPTGIPGDPSSTTHGNQLDGTPGNPLGKSDITTPVRPRNTQNCNKPIKLYVQIDNLGNVIKFYRQPETALSEQSCIEAAKEAAMKTKFKSAPDVPVRYGVVEYYYSTSK